MKQRRHTIRHIDPNLFLEARILALRTGQRVGDIINEALEKFLEEHEWDEDEDYE